MDASNSSCRIFDDHPEKAPTVISSKVVKGGFEALRRSRFGVWSWPQCSGS